MCRPILLTEAACNSYSGPRPKMGTATFDDLLPEGSSFTKKEDEPKTIGEMKKKTMAEETDPTKLKVHASFHRFLISVIMITFS